MQRMDCDGDGEVSAVYTQLFVGREGKIPVLAGRIFNLSQDDVGGQVHLQGGWDEELGFGSARVDVVALRNAKIQVYHGRLGALRRDQRNCSHRKGRSLAWSLPEPREGCEKQGKHQ